MSVKLIFTIWIESVVSAPLGAEMKGVIGEKKESRCEVMWANERKVDYQHMASYGQNRGFTKSEKLYEKLVKDTQCGETVKKYGLN